MTMPLQFTDELPEDPDQATRGRYTKWTATAEELRAHPGQWAPLRFGVYPVPELPKLPAEDPAYLPRYLVDLRDSINSGARLAFRPTGAFRAQIRCGLVWAQYVGTTEDEED
jgi:hypothetical protein